MAKIGFFEKLKTGLTKTRNALTRNLDNLVFGKRVLDQALFDELEELLISADMGPQFTYDLIDDVKQRVSRNELKNAEEIKKVLQERMTSILQKMEKPLIIPRGKPFVIMTIGVNGSGKTTTIGKLANVLKQEGHEIMLVAADTFRAAAVEQLEVWGTRVGASVVKHKTGADPAAVVFDGVAKIKAGYSGVVIVDTAGRLHLRRHSCRGSPLRRSAPVLVPARGKTGHDRGRHVAVCDQAAVHEVARDRRLSAPGTEPGGTQGQISHIRFRRRFLYPPVQDKG